jgi:hypothetical protein
MLQRLATNAGRRTLMAPPLRRLGVTARHLAPAAADTQTAVEEELELIISGPA